MNPSPSFTQDIRIGTLAGKGVHTADYIGHLLPLGFESFQINFWVSMQGVELPTLRTQVEEKLAGKDAVISSLGIFGNPLGDTADDAATRSAWEQCIDHARDFGCDVVAGFAGRVRNQPVDASMARFKEVFGPLVKRAADKGVRIAFENCPMGGTWQSGDWNIAFQPRAWDMIFNAIPADNLGLEWEPCHQLCQLIDPMPQLRKYVKKIFHVHGKDAKIHRDIVAEHGCVGPESFAFHKHPGFGDSDWTRIIEELRKAGFKGCIDIEGWHDDVYKGDLEMTGQVHALEYLKRCRTRFVPNPPHCV